MEVVQKEIQKLLDADVIYPISDSQWVSPIHVVPKKTGITVEKNATGEMVTTRVKNTWAHVHRLQEAECSNAQGSLSSSVY
ncbi:unnamed protein product [Rhodiola kirilowii]